MFILDANQYGHDSEGAAGRITGMIQEAGGEILVSRFWEERRLAYPIKGQRKGVYWLTYFRLNSVRLIEIQRKCEISEFILRQLFLKVDARIVETLVNHAKVGTIATYSVPEPVVDEQAKVREAVAAAAEWEEENKPVRPKRDRD
jgi:small subunit ribosomal protein S6